MANPIASLSAPSVQVQVSEFSWKRAAETMMSVDRPAITLVLAGGRSRIEASYLGSRRRGLQQVGRVVFTPPDTPVFGRTRKPGRVRLVSCYYERSHSEGIIGGLIDLSRSHSQGCLSVPSTLLPALMTRLMAEVLSPSFISTALVESLGQAVLLECAHALLVEGHHRDRGRLTPRHFRIIDDYLRQLNHEAPSVAALATACGFSERYFAKLFREQTKQSIGHYLRVAQIAKAQSYLTETQLPLKEIAARLGFSAASNFSAAFRAVTGVTPGHFRQVNRPLAP
ncbi:helix-turn-helix domain-containing protein [Steroidobacter agaridevorans]|nr:AraC family transcriptional regulator [Steroidobacter agaridevorans]